MGKKKSVGGRKAVKIRKAAPKKAAPLYNSDDDIPDETAANYVKDDIDMYNDQLLQSSENSSGDEQALVEPRQAKKVAVYDFSDSEEEEELESRLRTVEARVRKERRREEGSDSDEEAVRDTGDDWKSRAWGKKKDDFYGADIIGNKVDVGVSSDEEDEAEARLEEKEARTLQQRMLTEIDEQDFGLDMFTSAADSEAVSKEESGTGEVTVDAQATVQTDMSKLSDKEKNRLIKKEYPEFINIVSDYRDQLVEYRDRIYPVIQLYNNKKIPLSNAVKLLQLKSQILLDYCCAAQFYLLLRAEKLPVEGHPVIKRMVHFKQLLKQISEREQLFTSKMEHILDKIKTGKVYEIQTVHSKPKKKKLKASDSADTLSKQTVATILPETHLQKKPRKSKSLSSTAETRMENLLDSDEDMEESDGVLEKVEASADSLISPEEDFIDETAGEKEAAEFYDAIKQRKLKSQALAGPGGDGDLMETEKEELADGFDKRGITDEMQKNRGLTVKRPKSLKNPRVKNKLKYQRKKKIHKSMVPQVLTEMKRYGGEASGIRAGRVRSIPLS